jgi:hypothetical protein
VRRFVGVLGEVGMCQASSWCGRLERSVGGELVGVKNKSSWSGRFERRVRGKLYRGQEQTLLQYEVQEGVESEAW